VKRQRHWMAGGTCEGSASVLKALGMTDSHACEIPESFERLQVRTVCCENGCQIEAGYIAHNLQAEELGQTAVKPKSSG